MASASEGGPSGETEVEWQFEAPDLARVDAWLHDLATRGGPPVGTPGNGAAPVEVAAKAPRDILDRYLDTKDWRLARAGLVLRIRQLGDTVEVTVKDRSPASADGLRRRLEVTEQLPSGELSDLGREGPVGRRVRALAGERPLVPLVQMRTRRRPFSVLADGVELGELTLDETVLVGAGGDDAGRMSRVELEVAPGCVESLATVVDDLRTSTGIAPAATSKFEAGLRAVGRSLPQPPALGPTHAGAGSSAAELTYAALSRYVSAMVEHEPGTRLGEDPEELHDMRVATRRLRAAIGLFGEMLPARAQALARELGWIGHALGAVRDLDVQLERMPEVTAWVQDWYPAPEGGRLAPVRAALESERASARSRLLSALDSARWDRLCSALVELAREGPRASARGHAPAVDVVPGLVLARHRSAVKAAKRARRSGDPGDFHRLRIRCKRLRYSLDLTSELYGGASVAFARELAGLQDSLGRAQDAEVAARHIFEMAVAGSLPGTEPTGRSERPLSITTVFVMGALSERYRRDAAAARAATGTPLAVLEGKRWRKLSKAMDRARTRGPKS